MDQQLRKVEAVNGKIDLGFQLLIVSHVENACTIYAYTADDHHLYLEYKKQLAKMCSPRPPSAQDLRTGVKNQLF